MCRKYGVRWGKATEKEQAFIEEVTRVTYERDRALRFGTPLRDYCKIQFSQKQKVDT